jgi:hypothetical protein
VIDFMDSWAWFQAGWRATLSHSAGRGTECPNSFASNDLKTNYVPPSEALNVTPSRGDSLSNKCGHAPGPILRGRVFMFARKVTVCLKPNTLGAFTHLMESELLPWLKTQNGFLDLITLACPGAVEVQVITFWENERREQDYSEGYPENVLNSLQLLLDGISYGKTFEVVSSTVERFVPTGPRELKGRAAANRPDPNYRAYKTTA